MVNDIRVSQLTPHSVFHYILKYPSAVSCTSLRQRTTLVRLILYTPIHITVHVLCSNSVLHLTLIESLFRCMFTVLH